MRLRSGYFGSVTRHMFNRLVDSQEIAFNDRITVVYGERTRPGRRRTRGSSSGWPAPAVLVVCSPTCTPAHQEHRQPRCEYSLGGCHGDRCMAGGGHRRSRSLDGCVSSMHQRLRCTSTTTSPTSTRPPTYALFEYVHAALSKIHDELSAERARRAPKGNPFLSRFRRGTAQFSIVESLHRVDRSA